MECIRCHREIPDESLFCCFCGKRLSIASAPVQRRKRRRSKGSGSVYKLSGNRSKPWAAMSSAGTLIGTFTTSGEAVEALDAYNANLLPADRSKYTLQQVWESFRQSPAWNKLSDKGQEGLLAAWGRLSPLATRKALSVSVCDFQEIIDTAMVKPKYKERTAAEIAKMKPSERKRYEALASQPEQPLGYDGKNRIKQLVSHLYNEMIRLQVTKENLSNVLVLPVQTSAEKRNFTVAEKEILKAHDDDDIVKIILIYIGTGMRLNELLRLKKESVDLERRTLTGGSKSEAGRNRVVPILGNILPYVEYFYNRSKLYLIEENGRPLTDDTFRRRRFYPKLDELGIKRQDDGGKNVLTPHRARHTFIADSITGGMAPEALTKIAGYSRYDVAVDKYADDLSLDYLHAEMEKKA